MRDSAEILVVDDNLVNLKLARVLFEGEGFSVRTARGGDEALRSLARSLPRLILMDLQMPGLDGFELTRRIKADPATRGVIILAVTSYAMKGDEERALAAGCDAYVTKPIDTRTLPGIVAELLRRG